MTETERELMQKMILVCITAMASIALVAIIAITCNYMQTRELIESVYDYDYSPTMTQTQTNEMR